MLRWRTVEPQDRHDPASRWKDSLGSVLGDPQILQTKASVLLVAVWRCGIAQAFLVCCKTGLIPPENGNRAVPS